MPYIYFVHDGVHHVKIGKSIYPDDRLKSLQTGNPNKLELLYLLSVKSEKAALEIEEVLHEVLNDALVNGEWYSETSVLLLLTIPSFEIRGHLFCEQEEWNPKYHCYERKALLEC